MPEFYREIINEEIHVAIWDIIETETELEKELLLSKEALIKISQRKSSVHRKGYFATRQLLKKLNIDPSVHQYDEKGAPYLTDGRYISISHTKDKAAVVIGSTPVGIDLEYYQNKIKKISSRFLHKNEINETKKCNDILYLTQIWTAKEALYKIFRRKGINFRRQICVASFNINDSQGLGLIFYKNNTYNYHLHYRYFSDFCLTLATTKN